MNEDLAGLDLIELFDRLVLPDAPVSVSMWPQTAGWLWLWAVLLLVALLGLWRVIVWRRDTAYRRAAVAELRRAGNDPEVIADVLRRAALCGFAREQITELYRAEWLKFLDASAPAGQFASSDAGQILALAPYSPQKPHPELAGMAETWLRSHSRKRVEG